jgi:hypothetical protein
LGLLHTTVVVAVGVAIPIHRGLRLNAASHMGLIVQKHMVGRQADKVLQNRDHVIRDVAVAKKSVLESLPDLGHVERDCGLDKHVCLGLEADPDNVLHIVFADTGRGGWGILRL